MDIVEAALRGDRAGEACLADQADRGLVVVVGSAVRKSEAAHGFPRELLDGDFGAEDLLARLLGGDAGEDGVRDGVGADREAKAPQGIDLVPAQHEALGTLRARAQGRDERFHGSDAILVRYAPEMHERVLEGSEPFTHRAEGQRASGGKLYLAHGGRLEGEREAVSPECVRRADMPRDEEDRGGKSQAL